MLKEGLENINSQLLIIGVVEKEKIDNLDVLLQVSKEGFTASARVFLLEYCVTKYGSDAIQSFLEANAHDVTLSWIENILKQKIKWGFEPDDAAKALINAICNGNEGEIKKAVNLGGRIMTSDMLLDTIPFSNLSDEILEYLFANAMSLKVRCGAFFAVSDEVVKYSRTKMYDILCNMVTILVNLLIDDEGIVQ